MFGICRIYDAATCCGNQSGLLHEPINNNQNDKIDQETFDIVQRIRDGRRRLSPMGEMPILSGILFCTDCGSKLYQVRGRGWEHKKYTDIKELDAEMIREFVAKIIVHKAEKADGHRVQRIRTIYNDISVIELPKPTGHEKTA